MREFTYQQAIERSLMKRFKGPIYSKFMQAIDDYKLVKSGDKIAVALSGGKDSLLLAKLFQTWQKHSGIDFEVVFITMDPGFLEEHTKAHLENCEKLGIDVIMKPSRIFEIAEGMSPESPCFLCARMRRGFLYKVAKELGCNKLALGHHFDDVIETTLLNIFYAGSFKTMLPKAKSENYDGVELIRPLYLVKEKDVIRFMNYHLIKTMNCGCKVASCQLDSKRKEMKDLVELMRKKYVNTDINIFRSAQNVNINSILGYYDEDKKVSFLDDYE
jgi:tRNA(Ile)-lysidine synthase TilS/MesJ